MIGICSTDPITQRVYNHHRQALCTIRDTLPPPLGDTPQGCTERDEAIVASIARFVPASSVQAGRAAMVVAGPQCWLHCMRAARQNEHDAKKHDRLTAQAAAPPVQAAAVPGQAAPPPTRTPTPTAGITTAPPVFPRAASAASHRAGTQDDWPEPDWADEAERYAIIYPDRARLIRNLAGPPRNCSFGLPEAKLVRAIVAGTKPHLGALDAAKAGQRRWA